MAAITFPDLADERADRLAGRGLNGMQLALVALAPASDHADLELRFVNALHLPAILAAIGADAASARQVFRVRGGSRVPAGSAAGQVQVTAVSALDATRLSLRVEPVGDYSTYTLELAWSPDQIDPFFGTLGFKFRPGCFTNDCAPALGGRPQAPSPRIDYLAKDYDSFRHALMVAMAERVPGWASTSEADQDQVLIDLLAAAADELSDHQDRVLAEAYLSSARKRVSLARHARLVDYYLHEGNQASTWLALDIGAGLAPFTLDDRELVAWTGIASPLPDAVYFASRQLPLDDAARQRLDPLLNRLRLHTWGNARPGLAAGSTGADLVPPAGLPTQAAADALRDLVRQGRWREILVAELKNPLTGALPGHHRAKRQLLRLLPGSDPAAGAAESLFDPVVGTWVVRVNWRVEDALRFDYSFTTFCPGPPPATVEDVSIFFGNLLPVYEGRRLTVHFHEAGSILPGDTADAKHRYYTRMHRYCERADWVLAELPDAPLAYRANGAPDGATPARSTLAVQVDPPGAAIETWTETASLVHSDDAPDTGTRFMVETDELQRSVLRFGNGINGRLLPDGAVVHAACQIGGGGRGNVGADQLVNFTLAGAHAGAVAAAVNPLDVTDGRDPEPAERIRRKAPEAFRARQLRAVTLADYVKRAEEVDGVSRAVARYAWTGSWRTVRVAIDPAGFVAAGDARSDALWDELRPRVAGHLEAVRLIGEDLELRPPRYVPLEIHVDVCAHPEYWTEDLRYVLEQEFSDGWTADGRHGFFHPDEWTFGQDLHRSAIEGRIARVAGVEHVVSLAMKRFSAPLPGVPGAEVLEIGFDEVLLLANDPDHLERGLIRFEVQGGRR
jgi:hypothetical protein